MSWIAALTMATVLWQVESNTCLSGAVVHQDETVEEGDVIELGSDELQPQPGREVQLSRDGMKLTMRIRMDEPSETYESGAGPCPEGDTLEVRLRRVPPPRH